MGIGYTLTVVLMAFIREILGSGTWLGFQVLPESMAKMKMCIRDRPPAAPMPSPTLPKRQKRRWATIWSAPAAPVP